MTSFVNFRGEPVDIGAAATSPIQPRPKREQPAERHKGFIVVGYPAGAIDEAKAEHEKESDRWAAMEEDERSRLLRNGIRPPGEWSEAAWLHKNEPQKLSARPFSTPTAAADLKALAEKGGWIRVEVVELAKRKQ